MIIPFRPRGFGIALPLSDFYFFCFCFLYGLVKLCFPPNIIRHFKGKLHCILSAKIWRGGPGNHTTCCLAFLKGEGVDLFGNQINSDYSVLERQKRELKLNISLTSKVSFQLHSGMFLREKINKGRPATQRQLTHTV